jgi:hypothetical protein
MDVLPLMPIDIFVATRYGRSKVNNSFHRFICLLSDSRGNVDGFEPGAVNV